MTIRSLLAVFVGIFIFFAYQSAYVVNEVEQAVITQFGKVVGEPVRTPGLKWKLPFVQVVNRFPKYLLEWDGDPGQIPTLDKTYIWVDAFARWKIVDPVLFFQTVNNERNAKGRLDEIIDPAVRDAITSFSLVESVRNTDRKLDTLESIGHDLKKSFADIDYRNVEVGRSRITAMVLKNAQPKLTAFGIVLVDVKIKRINYVDQVRESVYGRMIAERRQIAEKYRSEGIGEAQKIRGDKEKELQMIESAAYRRAQEIKGEADAEVTRVLAAAYGVDPDFFSFSKTLENYGKVFDKESTLVITTESEFLEYLNGREPGDRKK